MEESWAVDNFTLYSDDIPLEALLGPKRDSLYIVIPITVIYAVIFLSGLVGNISTCLVIAKNKSMHTATNYYLFSLAVSDLLLLVSGLPQEMYSIWSRYPYVFGYTFCVLRGLFSETSANATVLTITAFTVERYVAICHPFLSHTLAKLSRIVKLILAIWIISICFAVPQALQFGVTRFIEDEPDSVMCQVVKPIMKHSFEVSTFLFFVAPMTLITVLYVLIGLRLRNSTNMMRKECGGLSGRHLGATDTSSSDAKSSRQNSSQSSRRVLKMLVAVVVAFFICWAPFHAQRLVAIYAPSLGDSEERNVFLKIYEITTYVSGVLYYVSTTINPLLYNIMSNKFREAFKETFKRCCCIPGGDRTAQRTYSVLSQSAQRGPESTDSGRYDPSVHTNTTLIARNSIEAIGSHASNTQRPSTRILERTSFSEEACDGIVTCTWTDNADVRITMSCKLDGEDVRPKTKFIAVHVKSLPERKLRKFRRLVRCVTEEDERKQLSLYYTSTQNQQTSVERTNKV